MKKILVTGSSGLIGSEVCLFFYQLGYEIHGLDNNQRAVFFGPAGDTRWNQVRLSNLIKGYCHHEIDIRDRGAILQLVSKIKPSAIVHCAAQPSHDKAASIPFEDFDTNAVGTLNLLEATRRLTRECPFVYLSTNKVYGDKPNTLPLMRLDKRYEFLLPEQRGGIDELLSIDQSTHSLFGASKVAGDIMVQEYGRYFDMPTCSLRGGCLTGPNHSGVELHGFLSYLVKCNLENKVYTVFGYDGMQVRDNIHSYDVANFIWSFIQNPRFGEVYNIGGGKDNSCSIIEAFETIESITGKPMNWIYNDVNRVGDHICYYSNLSKIQSHYPDWKISKPLDSIFNEICESWSARN